MDSVIQTQLDVIRDDLMKEFLVVVQQLKAPPCDILVITLRVGSTLVRLDELMNGPDYTRCATPDQRNAFAALLSGWKTLDEIVEPHFQAALAPA